MERRVRDRWSPVIRVGDPGATSDPTLLLRALEVAKEWREAVYAAQVLPEWLYAPRLVLEKLHA